MQAERDALVKKIFPQLRKLCMERGVGFTEVDLRWGVTRDQAERGEVLPICLDEITKCRPYFIGLLGERYGWIPDFIPDELIKEQPWLAEHRERSVTEMEIVHGVLNDPEMTDHAFFYFRDPALSSGTKESQSNQDKQAALKTRIGKSGFPVRKNYPDAESVGRLILKDLTDVIDHEFPEQNLSPLQRERLDHEIFGESRAKVYIGRAEYFDRLDEHVTGSNQPLVVLGESGSGKTALLANWVLSYQKNHPETFLLAHFIGSSAGSTDYAALLRRIMGEIKERYKLSNDLPDKPDALRQQFPNWLAMAAARGRFILLLDGLNQLEDKDNAPDLIWLPEFIPPEIKLIVSTLPGRSLEALKKRCWPEMKIQLLEPEERKELIEKYLHDLYSKHLPEDQINFIASRNQSANPLFLRGVLEELRLFGIHEELPDQIKHYLQAKDPEKLYELILARLEKDYEQNHPGLVGKVMALLWAARRGLSESEILEILNLPPLIWSPLFLALEDALVSRSGLLTFSHDFLRQAAWSKYLASTRKEQQAHMMLADFFLERLLDNRKIDELPWQLAQAQAWAKLQDCLTDLSFFQVVCENDEFEVLRFWQKIEDNSSLTCAVAYEKVLKSSDKFTDVLFPLSKLFFARGNLDEAFQLGKILDEKFRDTGNIGNLQASLGNQAMILQVRGDLDGAMALHKEEERICRDLGNVDSLQRSLGNQGMILQARGDLDGAMALYKETERICQDLGDVNGLSGSFGNQANILQVRGDLDGAMALYKETERICRELGNVDILQKTLGNQAMILLVRVDLDGAMILLKEQERICRDLGNVDGLQISLGNQACILRDRGDLDGAMALYKETERICRDLGNVNSLQASFGNQANILADRGDLDGAMALHKEEERICRDLGNVDGLQISLGGQSRILQSRDDLDGAMALLKEQERICRDLGNVYWLRISLGNQAYILQSRDDLDGAMVLLKEEERICRDLGDADGLQISLGNQACILRDRGDLDGAMALHEESERICREMGND
ncbi:MAG: NACHT domain-containing protein [Deltaproteobacteria bacterium]|nr:NACHT domain-containing protein [Candidatus Tharpella sp.]